MLTDKQKHLIGRFEQLAKELGSEKKAGDQIGVASSIVSQLRSEKYIGDVEYQFSKLEAYFDTKDKAAKNYTKVDYAPTTISKVVYKTLENIKIKGGLTVITGDAGIGKTKALQKYAEDNTMNNIIITIDPCIKSTKPMLKQIAAKMGLSRLQSKDDLKASITDKLHDGMIILVDEAQMLIYDSIETLRAFSDHFDRRRQTLSIALVGNDEIREKIEGRSKARYDQVRNRSWQRPQLRTLDVQYSDIEMLLPVLSGQKQELTFLHKIAQTSEGIRGAVKLFVNTYDKGNYDLNGLIEMAKIMRLDLRGAEKAVRT